MTALEAGGSVVVRCNWHKHISEPLQTGTARLGVPGRLRRHSGDSSANGFSAHRSEKVPVI